ncbi:MAG TPA: chromate efflux transporter [Opitutaceae bacterium]|nr:chromate efflux transporter [Opitutaceae bacterium]HND61832.1 chromate efflux transporter [Opitutaceae bacterium]
MSNPRSSLAEVARIFLRLGLTSFGGPVAHLGYLHEEIVRRRQWLDEAEYADLVALCQFLPGPASSQLVFALGQKRAGLAGALTASLCFTLPSAALMIAFGYGVTALAGVGSAGWLHGLKLAAVAVVAQAVWVMARKLCPDAPRIVMMVLAAAALVMWPGGLVQLAIIAVGAAAGALWYRKSILAPASGPTGLTRGHRWAVLTLAIFAVLLVALPALAATTNLLPVRMCDSFYRAGSLVFGGGHVVLPLLRAEVVPPGWISDDRFLAGYGLAQAVPGPLFTFAAYLGAVILPGPWAWAGGLLGLLAVFLPAWLLIGGALPFWSLLRAQPAAQAALRGANAAVVGVLLAALYRPLWTEGITNPRDALVAAAAFVLLMFARAPSWLVVLAAAAAGQWLR